MVACDNCSSIMKKCIQCRTQIDEMVPLSVCYGGEGSVTRVTAASEERIRENNTKEQQGINKSGMGVAMNNTVPATPVAALPSGTFTNNQPNINLDSLQLHDVQKLQQELQDIKEQVSNNNTFLFMENGFMEMRFFRQCVRSVSIVLRIWYSYAAMAPARTAVIK